MSKRGYISRYLLILKKLKVKPYCSYEELLAYLESQLEYLQVQDDTLLIGFSKRTLQRDIKEIRNLFGIDIEFSKTGKGYYIMQNERENMNFQRMMEAFDVFNSLSVASELAPYIHLEKGKSRGTENLYGLLHAIKNNAVIKFDYKKFGYDGPATKLAAPYGLKEFRNRWYLLARDQKDGIIIKTFALDRLTSLEITREKFKFPADFSAERHFEHCFGIIASNDDVPQDVVLSFDPWQGNYIMTLPLHRSQQVISSTKEELLISLKVFITHDFIMELLSFGESVKVLQPDNLATQIKSAHQKAFELY